MALGGPLNRGKFREYRMSVPSQISADKPILVAQFANSSDFDSVLDSDPFMVIVPPVAFYSANYTVPAPNTDFTGNFLNLIVPNTSIAQVVLDGSTLPASTFSAIGASGYSGAKVPVNVGAHRVSTSTGANFGLVAYGWSLFDGYGFPGQTCGFSQFESPGFTCPPREMTVLAGEGCIGPLPDLAKSVGNAGQALFIR